MVSSSVGYSTLARRWHSQNHWNGTGQSSLNYFCVQCVWSMSILALLLSVYFYSALPCHLLRGSGSTVLTATGFVNGNHWFSPPHKLYPLQPIAKEICQRWLRRQPLPVCQIWCKSAHGGLLGKCVKYNQNFYFVIYVYPLFLRTHLQVRPIGRFSRLMAQTTRTHARMCLWGFRWYCCQVPI